MCRSVGGLSYGRCAKTAVHVLHREAADLQKHVAPGLLARGARVPPACRRTPVPADAIEHGTEPANSPAAEPRLPEARVDELVDAEVDEREAGSQQGDGQARRHEPPA